MKVRVLLVSLATAAALLALGDSDRLLAQQVTCDEVPGGWSCGFTQGSGKSACGIHLVFNYPVINSAVTVPTGLGWICDPDSLSKTVDCAPPNADEDPAHIADGVEVIVETDSPQASGQNPLKGTATWWSCLNITDLRCVYKSWPVFGTVYYARGKIYDVDTTSGIAGARVRLEWQNKRRSTSTGIGGQFERCVWSEASGNWVDALASKSGYAKRSKSFSCSIPCEQDPAGCPDVYDCQGDDPAGGLAALPDMSGSSSPPYIAALAGIGTAVALTIAGVWYTRRRNSR